MPNINWNELTFQYMPTKSNIRYTWKDGEWDEGSLHASEEISLHIAASCLHYGQECFEGLKAFSCKDGVVRIFRPDENARRISSTSQHILGPSIPVDLFWTPSAESSKTTSNTCLPTARAVLSTSARC
jgi:branched-chain amino acid aminotransferase